MTPPPAPTDDDDRARRRWHRLLWAASLVVCPVAIVVVAVVTTAGPRPEGGPGKRVPVVDPVYFVWLHALLSCFAAWAAFTVWGRWWLVGWGVVLLAGLATAVVTVAAALQLFYG